MCECLVRVFVSNIEAQRTLRLFINFASLTTVWFFPWLCYFNLLFRSLRTVTKDRENYRSVLNTQKQNNAVSGNSPVRWCDFYLGSFWWNFLLIGDSRKVVSPVFTAQNSTFSFIWIFQETRYFTKSFPNSLIFDIITLSMFFFGGTHSPSSKMLNANQFFGSSVQFSFGILYMIAIDTVAYFLFFFSFFVLAKQQNVCHFTWAQAYTYTLTNGPHCPF